MANFAGIIKKSADAVSNFFVNVLGSTLVLVLMCLISAGAVLRYGFGSAQGWINEVCAYSMLVLAFLGTGEVLKRHSHVNIDIFINMLSTRKRALVNFITSIVGMSLTAALGVFSLQATADAFRENAMLVGMVEIPRYYLMAFMPVGFLLLTIYFANHTNTYWRVFTGKESVDGEQALRH